MYINVEGFILSEIDYKESSKILNVFTKEKGLIGIIAKGAKRLKSPFRALSHTFVYGNFNIYYKENKLSILVSIDQIDPLSNIVSDITLISYLTYVSDITNQVLKNEPSLPFEPFINSVLKLNESLNPVVITNILETKYTKYLGIDILKDESLSNDIIKLLKIYESIDISTIKKTEIKEEQIVLIDMLLSDYYDTYSGLYLKSKEFLKNVLDM